MGTYKCDLEQNSTMNLCTHHATPNLIYYFIYLLCPIFFIISTSLFWALLKQILGVIIAINTSANDY